MNLYGDRNSRIDKAGTFDLRGPDVEELYSLDLSLT